MPTPAQLLSLLALVLAPGVAAASGVTFRREPRAHVPCHPTEMACAWEYLMVPERYSQHAGPFALPRAALDGWVFDVRDQLVPVADPQPRESALPRAIEAASGVGWLVDRLGVDGSAAPLTVSPAEPPSDLAGWRRLVLDDDVVGAFSAYLSEPRDPGPHPAVLLVHGHGDDGSSMVRERLGQQIADAGFVVLSPTFRVNDGSVVEDFTTRALLEGGFTLVALRVYEIGLALRLLRAHPGVDPTRVAIVAHSGGVSPALLVVRLLPWVAGLVVDNEPMYWSEGTDADDPTPEVLDDTVPLLYPIHPALRRLDALPLRSLQVPYGLSGSRDAILAFLRATLGP